jgi:hypothetical protein
MAAGVADGNCHRDFGGNHRRAGYEPSNTQAATRTHDIGPVYPASFLNNNTKRTAVLAMDPDGDVSACDFQRSVASKASRLRLAHDFATARKSGVAAALLEMWAVPRPPGGWSAWVTEWHSCQPHSNGPAATAPVHHILASDNNFAATVPASRVPPSFSMVSGPDGRLVSFSSTALPHQTCAVMSA